MFAIAIHGGAGLVRKEDYKEQEAAEFEEGLRFCLDQGYRVLEDGGSSLEAVTAATVALEDCPLFNAGCGSVLNADEKVQMDASVMCGETEKCGAVTLIEHLRNPVLAARMVMERTPHRLLGGPDAERLAKEFGLEFQDPSYFIVPRRLEQLKRAKEKKTVELDHGYGRAQDSNTVGAVALDTKGNLAAATSTGGLTNRLPGRVSDSSVIGAGTYANNETLAISGTGTGDFFIQNVLCFDAHALMRYLNLSLSASCERALDRLAKAGGEGGVIALNRAGEICVRYNTAGMFRAWRRSDGNAEVYAFR